MSAPVNGTSPAIQHVAALDRLEKLVNSEQFADVVFSVGSCQSPGTVMFGHKAILSAASDVFRTQFTGNFLESNASGHEIAVIDIEPEVFREILRYAYCDRATVTGDNVLQLWYAATKYLFVELTNICTEFLEKHLTEENVLQIFAQNRRYELEDVNRKCLDVIQANPIRVFADEHFLTLDSNSLELITESERMNCKLDHLLRAIEAWLKINEHDADRGNAILGKVLGRNKLDHMCKSIYNFSSGCYRKNIDCQMVISAETRIFIHGIGIPIKLETSFDGEKAVRLDVSIRKPSKDRETVTSISVPASESMRVEEVMFEKQEVGYGQKLTIQVQIGNTDWAMCAMPKFTPDRSGTGIAIVEQAGRANCISYVLYSEDTKDVERTLNSTTRKQSYVIGRTMCGDCGYPLNGRRNCNYCGYYNESDEDDEDY